MVRRHELTDAQWKRIEPLLPGNGKPGGQWAEHRKVISGVLYRARTGVPWRDLPERFGPWQTVYERHRRWSADGTWAAILEELQIEADASDPDAALAQAGGEWAVNIDSTSCRAHQHAAGARRRPPGDFPKRGAGRGRILRGPDQAQLTTVGAHGATLVQDRSIIRDSDHYSGS